MNFTFVKTESETYALYLSVVVYLIVISIIISRYLKIIRTKKQDEATYKLKKRRPIILGLILLFICSMVHVVLYFTMSNLLPDKINSVAAYRSDYFITILITFVLFVIFMGFGFYLKGNSTLPKQQGPVTGV